MTHHYNDYDAPPTRKEGEATAPGEDERLRAARLQLGRTAASVARAVGISSQYLNDLEYGRRRAPGHTYAALCAELGIENDRPEVEVVRLRAELATLAARAEAAEGAVKALETVAQLVRDLPAKAAPAAAEGAGRDGGGHGR